MYHGGLHAYIEGREAIPSGATSGHDKPPSSGQAPSPLDLGVHTVDPLLLSPATVDKLLICSTGRGGGSILAASADKVQQLAHEDFLNVQRISRASYDL